MYPGIGTAEAGLKMTKHYSAKMIMEMYSVSYGTARNWIMKLNGDDTAMIQKNKGRGKRSWRLRRLDVSRLQELDQFVNG
jgi:transposase